MPYRTHLIQYRHNGSRYAVTVLAHSPEDAAARAESIRRTASLLENAPHINRTVDSLTIDSWNAAVKSVITYLKGVVLHPTQLPVSDPMLLAPIAQALQEQIAQRFLIVTQKEILPQKEKD